MVCEFANGVKLVLSFEGWRGTCGVTFEGQSGRASVADGYSNPDLTPPSLLKESGRLTRSYAAGTGRPFSHLGDFLSCVKSRRSPVADAGVMQRSMTANHAINLCLALERDLMWDPEQRAFVGDEEANRLRLKACREPWRV